MSNGSFHEARAAGAGSPAGYADFTGAMRPGADGGVNAGRVEIDPYEKWSAEAHARPQQQPAQLKPFDAGV